MSLKIIVENILTGHKEQFLASSWLRRKKKKLWEEFGY